MDKKKKNADSLAHIDLETNACSITDCTGLIPAQPQSESELDAYKGLYDFEAEIEQ